MSRQICRDFQRGSCRFGTRCKFLHQTGPTQQQNAFNSGPKQTQQQQQGFGTNRYGAFNSTASTQRTPQQQTTAPAKEHRCGNPKVCLDQIKEDVINEQPTFWRLTSYAHWKFLPNDITGDISPEELRALAYDSAKQGSSAPQIVQKEQSLVAAKRAEFEALQRGPYSGPATSAGGGFQQGLTQSSPFGKPSGFGTPAAPTGGFGQPQTMFGVPVTAPAQSGGGFLNATKPSPSPFQSSGFGQNSQFGQAGFGSQAPKSIFGSAAQTFPASGFGSQAQTPPAMGSSVFGGGFGSQSAVQPTSTTNSFGFGASPFNTPASSRASPFNTTAPSGASPFNTASPFGASPFATPQPAATPAPSTPAAITAAATFSSSPLGSATPQTTGGVEGIWQKETWRLGEIPEEEPPDSVRY